MEDEIYIKENDWFQINDPFFGYIQYGLLTSKYREKYMFKMTNNKMKEIDCRFCKRVTDEETLEKLIKQTKIYPF
jgi:hypothetical protein